MSVAYPEIVNWRCTVAASAGRDKLFHAMDGSLLAASSSARTILQKVNFFFNLIDEHARHGAASNFFPMLALNVVPPASESKIVGTCPHHQRLFPSVRILYQNHIHLSVKSTVAQINSVAQILHFRRLVSACAKHRQIVENIDRYVRFSQVFPNHETFDSIIC